MEHEWCSIREGPEYEYSKVKERGVEHEWCSIREAPEYEYSEV